jgi:hypothetical protein
MTGKPKTKPSPEVFIEELAVWCFQKYLDSVEDEGAGYRAVMWRIRQWKEQT